LLVKKNMINIIIGFITYGESTSRYLLSFLESINRQTFKDFKILAIDNSENKENENNKIIKEKYPEIEFNWAGKNIGFAKALNIMINKAISEDAEYFLALNPDMILKPDFVENIIKAIQKDNKIGAIAPKILKWDFKNNIKTNIVDSYGLSMNKEHRFYDRFQGNDDDSSKKSDEVFGFTGAAVLFNLKALKDISYSNEYFDELMFMYKEDCDLSYRLRLAGWKIIFLPDAVAYHDRTASPKGESNIKIALNRKNKSKQVKKWSFLNQWIMILKYKNLPFSFKIKYKTLLYQIKSFIYVLFFEQYLLKEFIRLYKLRKIIKQKRDNIKVNVNIREIEKYME